MIISLAEIMQIPNGSEQLEIPVEAEKIHVAGMDHKVISKEPLKLTVTNLGDRRVALQGSCEIKLAIPCSRCLDDVTVAFPIEIDEEVDFKKSEAERMEDLDEGPPRLQARRTRRQERLRLGALLRRAPLWHSHREQRRGSLHRQAGISGGLARRLGVVRHH